MDFHRGTFRVRGDVIDIFPAEHAEHAIRVSLFDDEVEALQFFDPLTGQMLHKAPGIHGLSGIALRDATGDGVAGDRGDQGSYFVNFSFNSKTVYR